MHDAYLSVMESLYHAGFENDSQVEIKWVESEDLPDQAACREAFADVDGIIVPGGFGDRGIEGMIQAAQYARENDVPYFGICLGMQIMVMEFARHVLGYADANSSEFTPEGHHNVIDLMADQQGNIPKGGTMRLGKYPCTVLPGTKMAECYGQSEIWERHRRAADYINPVVVNLHEPYASSAAELVTEVLMYAVEKKDVLPIEAESLMAGICLDTKFFNVRTGERTFEAAAVLRRLGADTTEVKKLMQNDFQDTMAKYQIIKSSRLYRQEIAIAALNTPTTRVLAAQAADELLNISGITASFVLYPDGEQVIISARSIGSANVQMILEPLGGGGNTATAGAQMKDTTVKEALDELVASIDKFYEE